MRYLLLLFYFSSASAAIFGEDNRFNPNDPQSPAPVEMSQAVGMLVESANLIPSGNSDVFFLAQEQETYPFCPGLPFLNEPKAKGMCTSFLINEDTVMTAGFCVRNTYCENLNVVFDFQHDLITLKDGAITGISAFQCQSIQRIQNENLALIKLKKKVTGRMPFKLKKSGKLELNTAVFLLSFTEGLPLKISAEGKILKIREQDFIADLEAFPGSAGGPVINQKTLEVEGVLYGGVVDYTYNHALSCYDYRYYSPWESAGDSIYRIK